MYGVRTLEQLQLHVLAMQLLIDFFTALLPDILANDFFIAMTAYRTDARTLAMWKLPWRLKNISP